MGFLKKCSVFMDLAVTKVFEPVDALVPFFERDLELGLELRPRATFSGRPVIGSDRVGRFPPLCRGFLGFSCARDLPAECEDGESEEARSLDQVVRGHGWVRLQATCRAHSPRN
jgi:hypothetical protein